MSSRHSSFYTPLLLAVELGSTDQSFMKSMSEDFECSYSVAEYNENVYYCLIEEKINRFHKNIMDNHLQYGNYDFCIQWNFKFNNNRNKTKIFDFEFISKKIFFF